jgi:hypothetical protein
MGKAVGRRFCGQGIDGIEQGISGASETAVDERSEIRSVC